MYWRSAALECVYFLSSLWPRRDYRAYNFTHSANVYGITRGHIYLTVVTQFFLLSLGSDVSYIPRRCKLPFHWKPSFNAHFPTLAKRKEYNQLIVILLSANLLCPSAGKLDFVGLI